MADPGITDGTTTVTFISLAGTLQPNGQTSRNIRRANVDGKAFHHTGQNSPPGVMTSTVDIACVDDDDPTEIEDEVADYKALQGKYATVTEDTGLGTEDVYVADVQIVGYRRAALGVGGINGGNWLLVARWLLESTATT